MNNSSQQRGQLHWWLTSLAVLRLIVGVDSFSLTPMEIVFLVVAVVVTVPLLIFLRYVLRELKKEPK